MDFKIRKHSNNVYLLGFVAANEASWMITFLWKKLLDWSHFTLFAKSQTIVFWLNLVP